MFSFITEVTEYLAKCISKISTKFKTIFYLGTLPGSFGNEQFRFYQKDYNKFIFYQRLHLKS